MMYIVFISLQIPKGRLSAFQTTPSPQQNHPMAVNKIALPGRKGVKSRTATKPAWPMRHSSWVKIRKRYIVRTGDMFHMNDKFSKTLPTKTCLTCKASVGAGRLKKETKVLLLPCLNAVIAKIPRLCIH